MLQGKDIERADGEDYHSNGNDTEREALLSAQGSDAQDDFKKHSRSFSYCSDIQTFGWLHLWLAFLGGVVACLVVQYAFSSFICTSSSSSHHPGVQAFAAPYVGSTERHQYPPTSPTNAIPTLFPTSVGFPGGTPTGAEPALVATAPAYPIQSGAGQLVVPTSLGGTSNHSFDLFRKWGNLSPWYSVGTAFGLDSSPEPPETCRITGLHLLHRHGARYPTAWTSYGGPAAFASRLHDSAVQVEASGDLEFLNNWTYKLGEEVLTHFGRQQLFNLGVSMRLKYGFLLKNFTDTNTIPVFRTESQHRMLHSALNFATGFFGIPIEGKYQQSITIEAPGFNNTLAPYETCSNTEVDSKAGRALGYVRQWASIYLEGALARLSPQLKGYNLNIEDLYTFQQLCAYETVALGYSKFCELFTEDEWEGFSYSMDLYFWYDSSFGAPLSRALGIGYVQELVARLTHTPIQTHNSSTNATLDDNPITFPLGQSLYVDATHEVVVLYVITALNLSNFAANGPLPADRIPRKQSFRAAELAPFATNVQFQLLACESRPGPQIRIIINDGVVPLTGIEGCPVEKDGMCPVDTFVNAEKKIIAQTDWNYDCHGGWDVPEGTQWNTTTGDPPKAA